MWIKIAEGKNIFFRTQIWFENFLIQGRSQFQFCSFRIQCGNCWVKRRNKSIEIQVYQHNHHQIKYVVLHKIAYIFTIHKLWYIYLFIETNNLLSYNVYTFEKFREKNIVLSDFSGFHKFHFQILTLRFTYPCFSLLKNWQNSLPAHFISKILF